jgi:hypothetical protein
MEPTFSKSSPEVSGRDIAILTAAALVGAAIYLLASARIYRVGFPLDDSWIHLTYARNLAILGEWAFQPGHLSAGSTAPLWTFLLSIGFWLHLGPYIWTYLLGELSLLGLAMLAESTVRKLVPTYQARWPWIGLFFVAEWHLQWAALSGMETILQALLITGVLAALMVGTRRYVLLGLLTGLSIWVRPDGLTLLGPVLFTIFLLEKTLADKGRALGLYLIGLGALVLPYLAFNLWLSGAPMPNTFYAKQAEYAAWQTQPLLYRMSILMVQLLTGPGLILFPGVIAAAVLGVRRHEWRRTAAMLWCAAYLLLYILRLPAYQHGRYLMPAMPIFFLFGLLAMLEFQKSRLFGRRQWAAAAAGKLSLLFMTVGFVLLGARSYAEDVGLIESEMVVTAKWVAANLPPQAVVAAHDIGALGYFDHHPLIDLAGLVSPEVIPIIRDEARLATFLDRRHANYLVAFPAFYPVLTRASEPVFTSGGSFAPAIGEKNMTVYRWLAP